MSTRSSGSGAEFALRLVETFRDLVDDVHAELAAHGHPGARPVFGFALQAIGASGATAAELGQRLGVSKQAAGKTIERLENRGYVERSSDPADARRKIVTVTGHGRELLRLSAAAFDRALADRADRVGVGRLDEVQAVLRELGAGAGPRLDLTGWLGGEAER